GQHAIAHLACELNADNLRKRNGDGQPNHDGLGFNATHAPTQNAQAVDHGRMAVGTDTAVRIDKGSIVVLAFPDNASDVLEMQLVHEALSGRHHLDAIKTAAAPAQEGESFSVALVFARQVDFCGGRVGPAVYLQGVINDDVDGNLRSDPGGITTCIFNCF